MSTFNHIGLVLTPSAVKKIIIKMQIIKILSNELLVSYLKIYQIFL